MAGSYPNLPAPRMAYDVDGTFVVRIAGAGSYPLSSGDLQVLNGESDNYLDYNSGDNIAFIFPQQRNIAGFFVNGYEVRDPSSLQVSNDTTNGIDGGWSTIENDWSNLGVNYVNSTATSPTYRRYIKKLNIMNIRAIKFNTTSGGGYHRWRCIHLYGTVFDHGETPDKLRMWHPTLDQPLDDNTFEDGTHIDWGDTVRGTSADRTFRVKNNSATLTANSIQLSTTVLTNTTPSLVNQFEYSDGGAFAQTLDIGNLAPGAISPLITVRRNTDISATLSVWTARIDIEPTSWS